jgi:hypothetical protein
MTELPDPLTPAECDLRHYDWMPITITVLKGSRSWMRCKRNPALAFYLINLWTASWHQVPAASLEDDDEYLCDVAQCDPKVWPKVRQFVIAGFEKCSDGRLYHQYVAREANKAWLLLLGQRARTEAATAARKAKQKNVATEQGGGPQQRDDNVTLNVKNNVTSDVTTPLRSPPDQTRPDQTKKEESICAAPAPPTTQVRGSRLPPEWQPNPDGRTLCLERGLNLRDTLANFRDYWHAKAGQNAVKLDWDATWRNWCRSQKTPAIQPKFRNGFAQLMAEDMEPSGEFGNFLEIEHVRN